MSKELSQPMETALLALAQKGGKAAARNAYYLDGLPRIKEDINPNTWVALETRGFITVERKGEKTKWYDNRYPVSYSITPQGWNFYANWLKRQPNPYYARLVKLILRLVFLQIAVEREAQGKHSNPGVMFRQRYKISPLFSLIVRWDAYHETFHLEISESNLVLKLDGSSYVAGLEYHTIKPKHLANGYSTPTLDDLHSLIYLLQEIERIAIAINADRAQFGCLNPFVFEQSES